MRMPDIWYRAKFCDGPLDGFIETHRAVNGVLLDVIGKSCPGSSGWEFARYVRNAGPDEDGFVRYVFEKDHVEDLQEKVPPWISVDERLPDNDRDVLLTDGTEVVQAWLDEDDGWQVHTSQNWRGALAWMPLPEPPPE